MKNFCNGVLKCINDARNANRALQNTLFCLAVIRAMAAVSWANCWLGFKLTMTAFMLLTVCFRVTCFDHGYWSALNEFRNFGNLQILLLALQVAAAVSGWFLYFGGHVAVLVFIITNMVTVYALMYIRAKYLQEPQKAINDGFGRLEKAATAYTSVKDDIVGSVDAKRLALGAAGAVVVGAALYNLFTAKKPE